MWHHPEISDDLLREAYRENLEMVLDEVLELLPELDGKTVISADHGELLEERSSPLPVRDYGHPAGVYTEELVKVPWHVHETENRKRIVPEPPVDDDSDKIDQDYIDEQLRNLGYKT